MMELPSALNVIIVTPIRQLFGAEVFAVTLPGENGELQILPGHLNLITAITQGALILREGNDKEDLYYVGDGFAEVCGETVTILVNEAAHYTELDRSLIADELDTASKLCQAASGDDLILAQKQFKRAEVRRNVMLLARELKLPDPEISTDLLSDHIEH